MTLAYPLRASVELVVGGPKTGKSTQLARHAAQLAKDGTSIEDILVIVGSPDALAPMGRQLEQAGIPGVRVATARELALEVLDDPDAIDHMGRKPRLLAHYEESFLMEDMKVTGLRPKRIRELTNFFYRSWTELADLNEGWLVFKEEEEAHAKLKELLDGYRAYVEPELGNAAVRWLGSNANARDRASFSCVLVDDYQSLNRASQHLAAMLANDTLFATANPVACARRFDSYPYAQGLADLAIYADNQVVELHESLLPADTAQLVNETIGLAAQNLPDALDAGQSSITGAEGQSGLELVCADDPAGECARVCAWVANVLEGGIAPDRIAITVPNKTWERNIAAALDAAGIEAQRAGLAGNVGGDIRYLDLSMAAQLVCLVMLASDPEDEPSLRAWCGFGEYLTNRSAFSEIFQIAHERPASLSEVLEAVVAGIEREGSGGEEANLEFRMEAQKVALRYQLLKRHLASLEGLRGIALVQAASRLVAEDSARESASVPPMARALFTSVKAGDDPQSIAAAAAQAMHFPAVVDDGRIKVVNASRVASLNVQAVAHMGMVNGFYPQHAYFDRTKVSPERAERMLSDEAKTFAAAFGAGSQKTLISWFERVRGADAERLGLSVERFSVRDGIRYARISQSVMLQGGAPKTAPRNS